MYFTAKTGGPSGLPGDTIFTPSPGMPPMPAGGGTGSGLGMPGDDIDGISKDSSSDTFLLCVSVDPFAIGVPGGPRTLPPFNLFHQSQRHQQAGDLYLSTEAYNRHTGILPPPVSLGLFNNVLAVNQSPVYFNDFGLLPVASPPVAVPPNTPLDDVDGATSANPASPRSLYFSLTRNSPSLPFVAGGSATPSGADLFFDPDITVGGNENLYASAAALHLLQADEIDAFELFDTNHDRVFDGLDQVLFSLAPNSPTLSLLGLTPGDILTATPSQLALFASHQQFGLLATDNVDSLDLVPLFNNSAMDTIMRIAPAPSSALVLAGLGLGLLRRRR